MDEPLSNLDARLREDVRGRIRDLAKQLGATVLYVTHDQVEAMAMADKIALMSLGELLQYGAPMELYRNPNCAEVAEFFGSVNWLPGRRIAANRVQTKIGDFEVPGEAGSKLLPLLLIAYIALTPYVAPPSWEMLGRMSFVAFAYAADAPKNLKELVEAAKKDHQMGRPGRHLVAAMNKMYGHAGPQLPATPVLLASKVGLTSSFPWMAYLGRPMLKAEPGFDPVGPNGVALAITYNSVMPSWYAAGLREFAMDDLLGKEVMTALQAHRRAVPVFAMRGDQYVNQPSVPEYIGEGGRAPTPVTPCIPRPQRRRPLRGLPAHAGRPEVDVGRGLPPLGVPPTQGAAGRTRAPRW